MRKRLAFTAVSNSSASCPSPLSGDGFPKRLPLGTECVSQPEGAIHFIMLEGASVGAVHWADGGAELGAGSVAVPPRGVVVGLEA